MASDAESRDHSLRTTALGKIYKGLCRRTFPHLVSLLHVFQGGVHCFLLRIQMCISMWLFTVIVSNWEIGFMVFGRRVARYEAHICCRKWGSPARARALV